MTEKAIESTISLIMIVRDEEAVLPRCLDSVRDLVSEMVIVDTGSRDRTVSIAEAYGARVYSHPWQDSFSEARNYGLPFAAGDWLLQLDADEELEQEDVPLIREYVDSSGYDAYSVFLLSDGPDGSVYRHRNVRLFRRGRVYYEGIVHNVPVVDGLVCLSPVRILHHGYNLDREAMERKFKRSERLLLRQVKEEPENTYARANLVRNYRLQRAYDQLIEEAEKALARPKMRSFDRQMILNDLLYGYFITGEWKKAEDTGRIGLGENPLNMDMWFILGGVMIKQGRLEEAVGCFRKYIRIRESGEECPGLEGLLTDTYGDAGRAWNNIARCSMELGRIEDAVEAYCRAIGEEPDNVIYYRDLASLYIRQESVSSAVNLLENAVHRGISDEVVNRCLDRLRECVPPASYG